MVSNNIQHLQFLGLFLLNDAITHNSYVPIILINKPACEAFSRRILGLIKVFTQNQTRQWTNVHFG